MRSFVKVSSHPIFLTFIFDMTKLRLVQGVITACLSQILVDNSIKVACYTKKAHLCCFYEFLLEKLLKNGYHENNGWDTHYQ